MRLRVLAEAEGEFEAARQYFESQRPGLGNRFIDDLSETLSSIAERPGFFPCLETLPDDQPFRRALLRVFRYSIVFELVGDEIVVIALAHTSREPNYWLGRRD